MKRTTFTLITLMLSTFSFAQPSQGTVIAYAKKKFPGYQVSDVGNKKLWEGLTPYYMSSFDLRHKTNLPGYPNVTEVGHSVGYFWSNGSFRQDGYYTRDYYEGMPKPDINELNGDLAKMDFAYEFGKSDGIIEVHKITVNPDFEHVWYDEKSLRIKSGTIIYTKLGSGKTTEKIKQRVTFLFKREDHKSPWTKFNVRKHANLIGDEEILETKQYSGDEWIAIENSTYYQKHANENAKREWDALVPLEIPMESPEQMSVFAHNLFLNGSREEIKSFLYKTTPSGLFYDGTDYLLTASRRQFVESILKDIFDGEKKYREEYCETSVISQRNKYGYTFANHNFTSNVSFDFRHDADRISLVDCTIGYSQKGFASSSDTDAKDYPCRGEMTNLEKFNMPAISCSIEWPAEGEEMQTAPNKYTRKNYVSVFDAARYSVYATIMPELANRSNADRYSMAKNTVANMIEETDNLIHSEQKQFTLNGVNGQEALIVYNKQGKIVEEFYRFIVLGDIFIELSIKAPKLRENEIAVLNSFSSTLKGKGKSNETASSNDTAATESSDYKKKDQVKINTSGGWKAAVVTKVNGDGTYKVYCPSDKTYYNGPAGALKPNPGGKARENKLANIKLQ